MAPPVALVERDHVEDDLEDEHGEEEEAPGEEDSGVIPAHHPERDPDFCGAGCPIEKRHDRAHKSTNPNG